MVARLTVAFAKLRVPLDRPLGAPDARAVIARLVGQEHDDLLACGAAEDAVGARLATFQLMARGPRKEARATRQRRRIIPLDRTENAAAPSPAKRPPPFPGPQMVLTSAAKWPDFPVVGLTEISPVIRLIFHPQFGIENPRVGGSIPPPGKPKHLSV